MKIVKLIFLVAMSSVLAAGTLVAQEAEEFKGRQKVLVPDVEEGRALSVEFLKLIKADNISQAVKKYIYIAGDKKRDRKQTFRNFITSLENLSQQLGEMESFKYNTFALGDVREWVPGKENPGRIVCIYDVDHKNASVQMHINIVKQKNKLKIRNIDYRNLVPKNIAADSAIQQ